MNWKRKSEGNWGRLVMKCNWCIKKLSEIAHINPKESIGKGIMAKKVPMDKLQPFCRDIPEFILEEYKGGAKFRNGDTIMARITPCLENGKISKVSILDDDEVGFGSTEYIVFRAIEGVSDADFLYYLICSPLVRNPAIKSMVGSSGRQRVQTDVVADLDIELPNIKEQREIGSILRALDDKIALNNAINNNFAEQIKTICTVWLSDYAPFDGVVPSDWVETPLPEIAEFISGYSYKGNELIESKTAMATIKNFDRKGGFKLDGYKEIVPSSKLKDAQHAELFDTLVAHTDLTQNAEIIGNAEPIMSKLGYENIVFSMDLVKVIPKNNNISKFLIAAILQDKKFKAHCLGYVNGTTVLHLNKKALPEYKLFLPKDLSTLKPLNDLITVLYKKISANITENTYLKEIRNSILPKLISGELDVSEIDI